MDCGRRGQWLDDGCQGSTGKKVTAAGVQTTSAEGISLIKSFEGLMLTSYYCSSGVLTIGYGSTGAHVREGMTITEAEAERLLKKDLQRFEDAVNRLIEAELTQHEFDAIVSFTFNVGTGALQDSTFRRRMNAGEDKQRCFAEEFPKWVNGSGGPLPGLVRRRTCEVQLAAS